MRSIGIVLIVAGAFALLYTGYTFTTKKKVVDLGPIEVTKEQKHDFNWPPLAGAVLIVVGGAMIFLDRRP